MNKAGEDVFMANATSTTEMTSAETRKIRFRLLMSEISAATCGHLSVREGLYEHRDSISVGASDPSCYYSQGVKQFATMRLGQAAARYGEQAPLATTCCNACRTCVQTNVLTIALAGIAFLAAPIKQRLGRV